MNIHAWCLFIYLLRFVWSQRAKWSQTWKTFWKKVMASNFFFLSRKQQIQYVHKVSSSQVQLSELELLFIYLLFIKYKIYFSIDQHIWWRVKVHMKTVWETKRSLQKSPELCLFVVHCIVSQMFRLDLTFLSIYQLVPKNLG